MAQQVNIQVTIAGETVSPIADLSIKQGLFNHNVIQLVLPLDALDNNTQVLNQAKGFLNQPVTLEITSGLFAMLQRNLTFEGVVTDVRMARYQRGAKMVYITAYSPTIHLSGISNTRSFHEMSLGDIVNEVLNDVPGNMTTVVGPKYTETIEYMVQYKETNMQFLQRLANTYGEWMYYDGDEFIFGELPTNDPIDLPLEKDLLDMDLSMRVVPVNFKARAYDYLKHEVYESTATPSEVTDLDAFGEEILSQQEPQAFTGNSLHWPHQEFQSPQSLDDYARQEMAAHARDMVILSGTTDNIKLRVGSVINITGEKANEVDLDKFIIISVNHGVDQNFSYNNTIQAIPANAASPPANPQVRYSFCEIQQATVKENDDEKGMGRVQVNFKWMEEGQKTPWIRQLQPYAGQQKDELHGFFFTPEIDDEVLVGFINDNPNLPFVMGSVYRHHDSNHPQEWHDPKTKRKVLKTRDGNHIELIDGDKKIRIYNDSGTINEISLDANNSSITITNAGGNVVSLSGGKTMSMTNKDNNSLVMSEGKEITITSKDGKITVNAKEINILADEKMYLESKSIEIYGKDEVKVRSDKHIDINATEILDTKSKTTNINGNGDGNKVNMEATEVSVTGKDKMSVEGKQTSLKGEEKIDVQGNETTVKGTQKVSLEGAEMSVKGTAKTNIDGGALTEIKGAMLKLN